MPVCNECGGTVIEYDHVAGICVRCGTVVEENMIVNEVGFGEAASGAAVVQGSFVAQGATHARMSGPYGNRGSNESREQTIANANKKIQSIANALRLSEVVCLAATRLYTLAVEHKFTKGRKSLNVVAVCLYVACRQKETKTYMLIDFSDLLQVNVFELGHTYLQLVQTLNLRLPLIDPSHHISRFAALLEFGADTPKVATDAVRLVQRFDRDWLARGRRPAGICGAALLLAARMNNFRRSVEEVVQVVKIADTTLKKRLDEFRATPSGGLTLADFRKVWLEEEMDPPAFTRGREREEAERAEREKEADGGGEQAEAPIGGKTKAKGKKAGASRKGKRKRGNDDDEDADAISKNEASNMNVSVNTHPHPHPPFDPALLADGILAGALDFPSTPELDLSNIDPVLLEQSGVNGPPPISMQYAPSASFPASLPPQPDHSPADHSLFPDINPSVGPSIPQSTLPNTEPDADDPVSTVLAEEVSTFLHNPEGLLIAQALDVAEARRTQERRAAEEKRRADARRLEERRRLEEKKKRQLWEAGVDGMEFIDGLVGEDKDGVEGEDAEEWDELAGLDEEELDRFILGEEEVRVKERVWVELNREYLEAIVAKGEQLEGGAAAGKRNKRRKPNAKPRDSSTAAGGTAAESVRNLIKKHPKYSKRINYDALKDLFVGGGGGGPLTFPGTAAGSDDKDGDGLYYMAGDDKDDEGERMLIIEEGPGTVAAVPSVAAKAGGMDADADGEDEEGEEDDEQGRGDEGLGWEDAWEQEV